MIVAGFRDLFHPPPPRWGLRGDPHLWQAMRETFAASPLPRGEAALLADVARAFRAVVGQDWQGDAPVPVAALHQDWGGMSNGMVDPRWWRETGVPLLIGRLRNLEA